MKIFFLLILLSPPLTFALTLVPTRTPTIKNPLCDTIPTRKAQCLNYFSNGCVRRTNSTNCIFLRDTLECPVIWLDYIRYPLRKINLFNESVLELGGCYRLGSCNYKLPLMCLRSIEAGSPCFIDFTSRPFQCVRNTNSPSLAPTNRPTKYPTTKMPTSSPTRNPTKSPTQNPTDSTPIPTSSPTHFSDTSGPTISPTQNPTQSPTKNPTANPSFQPTFPTFY